MSELPPGWTQARFGEINSYVGRTVDPSSSQTEEFELYSVPSFPTGRPEVLVGAEIGSTKQTVEPDDVLVCKINPRINRVWQVMPRSSHRQIASSEWIVLRAGGLNPSFLRHYFRSPEFRDLICDGVTGVGGSLTRAQPKRVAEFPIPIAPLLEQKRIADKLDALLARVDACRGRLDRVPVILKGFRESVLAAATSGELTRDWREERGMRMDWSIERAADVCAKVQSGGTPKEGFVSVPGVPFLKVYNIVDQKVSFEYRPQFVVSTLHHGALKKSQAKPGDVVMNIVGPPLGKVAIVPTTYSEWNINQALTLFRPSDRILSGWLYVLLCGGENVRAIAHETKGSAGQTNISLSQCRDFRFPVPSVEEQAELVRRVALLFGHAEGIESRLRSASHLMENFVQASLSKAFRGALVPQNPSDEPAPALLAKLKKARENAAAEPSRRRPKTPERRPKMKHIDKGSVKAAILMLEADRFSFDELRARVSGDYESLKATLFELLEEPSPVVSQVYDTKAKTMQLVRVRP